jgi:hypothetical protein
MNKDHADNFCMICGLTAQSAVESFAAALKAQHCFV